MKLLGTLLALLLATTVRAQFGVGIRNDTPSAGGTTEGTAVLATGENAGSLLAANGSGGASWVTTPPVEVTSILSAGCDAGQVPTAPGGGGAMTCETPAAGGVAGDLGETANALVRADGTGGTTAKGSTATLGDGGELTIPDNGYIVVADPTNGHVAYRVRGDTDTGIGSPADNWLAFYVGGVAGWTINATQAFSSGDIYAIADFEARRYLGYGTAQNAVAVGASAATFNVTRSYNLVSADIGGNTVTTITCTVCAEGDRVVLIKSGTNALTISASGTGANQISRACVMDAADSTAELFRTEGGYWTLISCMP